jgi:hypothetical protein
MYYPICFLLEGKALLELEDKKMPRAAQLLGAALDRRDKENFPLNEIERPDYETWINTLRTALGDEIFNQLFENGKAMTLKDAIAFALEENSP